MTPATTILPSGWIATALDRSIAAEIGRRDAVSVEAHVEAAVPVEAHDREFGGDWVEAADGTHSDDLAVRLQRDLDDAVERRPGPLSVAVEGGVEVADAGAGRRRGG